MPEEYTKEHFWELYESLPQERKDAVFSEETAENIFNICTKNGVKDAQISEVARYAGRVLFGILSISEFLEVLEKNLNLDKDISQKITQEINRLIFSPVQKSLSEVSSKDLRTNKAKEQLKKSPSKDSYREPIL